MPDVLTLVLLPAVAAYFILITCFCAGWIRTPVSHAVKGYPDIKISILVPCRNEAGQIEGASAALNAQDYPKSQVEIIWIDDHSVDGTAEQLRNISAGRPGNKVVSLTGSESGKKTALKAGMETATGEFILLTDADSQPGPGWVCSMASCFRDLDADLIAGPVVLGPARTWQENIQKLEYLSLVAASVGSSGLGRPVMIQGPNIGVKASVYRSLVTDLDARFLSGDDVFLLQAMKKTPGRKIRYCLNREAIVKSKPAGNLPGFIRQRQRWASKAKGYSDPMLVATTLLVFLGNLAIITSLVTVLAGWSAWFMPLVFLGIKSAADLPLLIRAARFFHCTRLLAWFLPVQVFYPFYVVTAAAWAMTGRVRWK